MKKSIIKIWNVFTSALVALVVILALLLVGVRVFGMQVFTVLSGSMEPVYHVGSLIYVKETDPMTLQPGDVITFMLDENTVATHRIVDVIPDEEDPSVIRFQTLHTLASPALPSLQKIGAPVRCSVIISTFTI